MALETLFQPGRIGKLEIRNRLVMSPMATNYATMNGEVTREIIDHYVERARGGIGLIIVEYTRIETELQAASATGANLQLASYSHIAGMSQLTDAVHEYGAKIFVQLSLGMGSYGSSELFPKGRLPNAVSEISWPLWPDRVCHVLTTDEIEMLVEAFAEAALRAKMAGFDGIDTNGHGMYLLSQFMSPYTNKRTDKYGDTAALPLALIEAARARVGDNFPISFRWNVDEFLEGGRMLEQSQADVRKFRNAGIDAVLMSAGNFWVPGGAPHSCPPMSYPQGYLRQLSQRMKSAVDIPVILPSKIRDPRLAAEILEAGEADFIGLGRALLADPEWPNKAAQGSLDDICPCIGDLDGCLERMASFRKVRCSVNARTGRESEYPLVPAEKPRRVLVVGGGPGGMEAARVAALRGHEVTLYEKTDRLGGRVNLAGLIPDKDDINKFTRYLAEQMGKLGVKIILGKEATPELVKTSRPDAVILATGARPLVSANLPGASGSNVGLADDVVAGRVSVTGEKVVVAGGGFVGLDTAVFLARAQGKQVTVIEQLAFAAVGIAPYNMNYIDLFQKLDELGVALMPETKIEEITGEGVVVTGRDGQRRAIKADSVVLATGGVPNAELARALRDMNIELRLIGDCVRVGKIIDAVAGGFRAAYDL